MRRGEIRRVHSWNYLGHETTGNRPCLIISPDWFNSTGNAIIAPLTTPGPNHEIGTYRPTVWRWAEGRVRPNVKHMMALLELADNLGLSCIFTE